MPIEQPFVGRNGLCIAGGSAEPIVSIENLTQAIEPSEVEHFRPLHPVGYSAGVQAYQAAASQLTARQLTSHYSDGLDFFHQQFVPELKQRLKYLSGDAWSFEGYTAFAAGSDVDLMTHIVEAAAAHGTVSLFPGDWYGFLVGCTQRKRITWDFDGKSDLACLCIPSVRNGHVTNEMIQFLSSADACLLNLNLFPTLSEKERRAVAESLQGILPKSILSISFSRGFGLTASQLGVILIPQSHPFLSRFQEQWNWFTYFYNAIAARAFLEFKLDEAQAVDRLRSHWVWSSLEERGLPVVASGSYYVRSFRFEGELPEYLRPLQRGNLVRMCFKPPQS